MLRLGYQKFYASLDSNILCEFTPMGAHVDYLH